MRSFWFWRRFSSLSSLKNYPDLLALHSQKQFATLLHKERELADRTGLAFSVIVFEALEVGKDHHYMAYQIAKAIRLRKRLTDEVGWFEGQKIAVLLPFTGPEGARKMSDDLSQSLAGNGAHPHVSIFTYPHPSRKSGEEGTAESLRSPPERRVNRRTSEGELRSTLTFQGDPWIGGLGAIQDLEEVLVEELPRWKRILDVGLASFFLLLFSPVMVVAALCIKVFSPGPIFFKQVRAGLGGKPFFMYKFRSMIPGAHLLKSQLLARNEQDGPVFKIKNDPRISRVGRILRTTSIDELPQLWNVMKGEMTLVGPRPPTLDEVVRYDDWQRRRLSVTPGLTCIWQVTGRSTVSFQEWVKMDLRYIKKRSLTTDLKLIFLTGYAVLSRKGAQ